MTFCYYTDRFHRDPYIASFYCLENGVVLFSTAKDQGFEPHEKGESESGTNDIEPY